MSNLYIFKIDKDGKIFKSRNLYNVEGKQHSSGRFFIASEYVNYLNSERDDKFFISYNGDDFFEKIDLPKKKIKNINENNVVRLDLKFEEFNLEQKYRIIRKSRFEDKLKKSSWVNKEDVRRYLEIIKRENKKKSRNPYISIVENAKSVYDYVYLEKDKIEEKEYLLEEKRKTRLLEKIEEISKEIDKKFNAEIIKKDFLLHVLNKIAVIDNFKLINNENICLIKTIIPKYDSDKLSINEQEKLMRRVFPSINFKEDHFINKEILNGNPHLNQVKKHKHTVIMSVLEKASILGITPVSLHYSALDKALKNHKLDIIETNKLKVFLDKLVTKVKNNDTYVEQNVANNEIANFIDKVRSRVLGKPKSNLSIKK